MLKKTTLVLVVIWLLTSSAIFAIGVVGHFKRAPNHLRWIDGGLALFVAPLFLDYFGGGRVYKLLFGKNNGQ